MDFLDSVPSTMDAARDNLRAGRVRFDAGGNAFPPGVAAREQTAGRGQRGRTWFARPGECLCATYYFAHGLNTREQAGEIAFVAGVAVADALNTLCANFPSVRIGLKWPNDILLNGKKVGGILAELAQAEEATPLQRTSQPEVPTQAQEAQQRQAEGTPSARLNAPALVALVGVGVNIAIRDFPPELAPFATSLQLEGVTTGQEVNWKTLAETVGRTLARRGQKWREAGFKAILDDWRRYDQTPGRAFTTNEGGVQTIGIAEGVADDGALRLRLPDRSVVDVRSASSLQEMLDQKRS